MPKIAEQNKDIRHLGVVFKKPHTSREILMCPPTYFSIDYQINPWMQGHINQKKAYEQWTNLKRALEGLGAKISLLEPVKYLPDMVFTADQGAIYDHIFIKSNFRHQERRRETSYTVDWFKKKGFTIIELPPFAYFEGQADMAFLGEDILLGIGYRTNEKAAKIIGKLLSCNPVLLRLVNPYFYHLDTALCVLPNKVLMMYEKAFDKSSLEMLKQRASQIISITDTDAKKLACNSMVYGNTIIMNKGCSHTLRSQLKRNGFEVVILDLSEFLKSGGGARCLTWNGNGQ